MKIEAKRILSLAVLAALAACAPRGDALYARAQKSLEQGDANAAIIDLKNLLQDEPKNAKARALLGKAFVDSGQIELGEVEIKKAKDLGAPKDLVLVSSCQVLIAKNEFEKALAECKPENGTAAQKSELQLSTSYALLGLGRSAESKAGFEALVKAEPQSLGAWLGYASAVAALDGVPAAKALLAKAPASVQDQPRYWLTLGRLDTQAQDLKSAQKSFETAVKKAERAPESIENMMALGSLAETQMRLGDMKGADVTTEQLMKVGGGNPMAMMLRGQVAAAGGRLEEARSLLEQVVNRMPDNADAKIMLATVNYQQGNLDQAEQQLTAVIANTPDNARAQQLLAEVRLRQGSPAGDSLASVQSALQQDAANPTMLATAGRLSLEAGDREQALTYLADAAKAAGTSDDMQARLSVANGYITAGEYDRALEVLRGIPDGGTSARLRDSMVLMALLRKGDTAAVTAEANKIAARSGKEPGVRTMVGSALAVAGNTAAARDQFNAALKLDPNDTAAMLNLARLDLNAKQPAQAEPMLQKVLEKDPKNLTASMGLAMAAQQKNDPAGTEKYLLKATKDHPDSVEAQVGLAEFYLATGKAEKAKAAADALVASNPQNAPAANARGMIMLAAGDAPAAISSFEQAKNLDPKSADYAVNLARAQMGNKDPRGAISTIDGALSSSPKSAQLLAMAAALSLQSGNNERATGYVERLRQAAPGAPVTSQMEGDLAMAQKRYAEALEFYTKADPKMQNRAITLARAGAAVRAKSPQADKILEQWIAANPSDVETIGNLAELRRARGDLKGAISLYEQSLQKAPDSAVLSNNLAMIYLEMKDPRALVLAEKAYKALPRMPAIQDTYGWALVQSGQYERAVDILASAANGMPESAEVQYHLAVALSKAGRKAEALAAAQKAVAGSLPPALKADAAQLLDELK